MSAAPFDLAETDRLLSTTRAVRKRLDLNRPVEREVILECLRLAVQAPTQSNSQTWRWMVVTDPDKKAIVAGAYRQVGLAYLEQAAGAEKDPQTQRVYDSAVSLAKLLEQVPAMVIPCVKKDYDPAHGNAVAASVYGSVIPATWSFQLALRARGLQWQVDAHGGRPVTSLGWVLGERLQRGPAPRVAVVALGSNARPGWDAVSGYRAMIAQLPATTTVVFVSVYRNPAYYTSRVARKRPDWNPRYSLAYTRAMHQVAAARPHTCVAPWRPWAKAHRKNLTGGVHPHRQGRRAWARIVARTVASCR